MRKEMDLSKFIHFHECKQVNGANPPPAHRFAALVVVRGAFV